MGKNKRTVSRKVATAPYNFVSLPYGEASPEGKYIPKYTRAVTDPDCELYSGTITCTLKALTPLMVAGPSDRSGQNTIKRFLSTDGQKVIMGSSLKGMFRCYVEAFACAAMHPVTDAYVYWRNVTGKGSGKYKQAFETDPQGGFLKKSGARYKFYPAEKIKPSYGNDAYQTGKFSGKTLGYNFGEPTGEGVWLDDEVVSRFLNQVDSNPAQGEIWKEEYKKLRRNECARVFCVYHKSGEKQGQVRELGVARYLRLPYPTTPADLAGDFASDDFCAQLFGYVNGQDKQAKARKGKLSFSECRLEKAEEYDEPVTLILQTPHPSCVQHYVDQWVEDIPQEYQEKNDADNFDTYEEGNKLRGRKFYWHRKTAENNSEPSDHSVSFIPVKKGAEGTFTITLHSVNEKELGAVLELLRVPEGSAFKMGMAKPYGYGSVQLKLKRAEVQKDSLRYSSLSQRLEPVSKELSAADMVALCKGFERYVCEAISDDKNGDYEDLQPIMDLRDMMQFDAGDVNRLEDDTWEKRTAYMGSPTEKDSDPAFQDKKILPYPEHVGIYE